MSSFHFNSNNSNNNNYNSTTPRTLSSYLSYSSRNNSDHGDMIYPSHSGLSAAAENMEKAREKAELINLILLGPEVNLWKLRELAITEGGLVNDQLRRRAWPKLLGLPYQRSYTINENDKTKRTSNNTAITNPTTGINNIYNDNINDINDDPSFSLESALLIPSSSSSAAATKKAISPPTSTAATTTKQQEQPLSYDSLKTESLDTDQVDRDVARCTWHLLTGPQRLRQRQLDKIKRKKFGKLLKRKQKRLGELINLTLVASYQDTQKTDELDMEYYKHLVNAGGGGGMTTTTTTAKAASLPQPHLPSYQSYNINQDDKLRYYQGYHDVASIFLVTLGGNGGGLGTTTSIHNNDNMGNSNNNGSRIHSIEDIAASKGLDLPCRVLRRISHSHFREPMRFNFQLLQITLRLVLFPLLHYFDKDVHDFLRAADMEPFFAISWVITWYSHDIRDTALVKRLFDFFIVSHPLMPMYLSVAMCLHPVNRMEILSTGCDFAELHQTLTNLPKNSSMVGWKWRLGVGGYVSDDDEEGTVATEQQLRRLHRRNASFSNMDSSTLATGDDSTIGGLTLDDSIREKRIHFSNTPGEGGGGVNNNNNTKNDMDDFDIDNEDDDESQTASLISSSIISIGPPARVPFQDLIDIAVSLIRRVPPRQLLQLATKYYGNEMADPLLSQAPKITLLHPPPNWALKKTAKADWVLKQRARELAGLHSTHRRDRKRKLLHKSYKSALSMMQDEESEENNSGATNHNTNGATDRRSLPVIAAGLGPSEREEKYERKRRKLIFFGSATIVAFAAIAIFFVIQYNNNQSTTTTTAATPKTTPSTKNGLPESQSLSSSSSSSVTTTNDTGSSCSTTDLSSYTDHESCSSSSLQQGAGLAPTASPTSSSVSSTTQSITTQESVVPSSPTSTNPLKKGIESFFKNERRMMRKKESTSSATILPVPTPPLTTTINSQHLEFDNNNTNKSNKNDIGGENNSNVIIAPTAHTANTSRSKRSSKSPSKFISSLVSSSSPASKLVRLFQNAASSLYKNDCYSSNDDNNSGHNNNNNNDNINSNNNNNSDHCSRSGVVPSLLHHHRKATTRIVRNIAHSVIIPIRNFITEEIINNNNNENNNDDRNDNITKHKITVLSKGISKIVTKTSRKVVAFLYQNSILHSKIILKDVHTELSTENEKLYI